MIVLSCTKCVGLPDEFPKPNNAVITISGHGFCEIHGQQILDELIEILSSITLLSE